MSFLKPVGQGQLILNDLATHALSTSPLQCAQIFLLNDDGQPINGNTGLVHLGTSDLSAAEGAFLRPGSGMFVDANSPHGLFVRATVAPTTVHWTAWG